MEISFSKLVMFDLSIGFEKLILINDLFKSEMFIVGILFRLLKSVVSGKKSKLVNPFIFIFSIFKKLFSGVKLNSIDFCSFIPFVSFIFSSILIVYFS